MVHIEDTDHRQHRVIACMIADLRPWMATIAHDESGPVPHLSAWLVRGGLSSPGRRAVAGRGQHIIQVQWVCICTALDLEVPLNYQQSGSFGKSLQACGTPANCPLSGSKTPQDDDASKHQAAVEACMEWGAMDMLRRR